MPNNIERKYSQRQRGETEVSTKKKRQGIKNKQRADEHFREQEMQLM